MLAVRTTSRHPVCRVAFSPCGSWFATAQPHHGVTLFDRATGEAVRTVGNRRRPDYSTLAFLHRGAWVGAGGSKGLEVFDAATGAAVLTNSHSYCCDLRLGCRGGVILAAGRLSVIELVIPAAGGRDRRGYWPAESFGPDGSFGLGGRVRFTYYEVAPHGDWAVAFREDGNPVAVDLVNRREAHTLTQQVRVSWVDALTSRNIPNVAFAAAPHVALGDGKMVAVFGLTPGGRSAEGGEVPAPLSVGRAVLTLPPPDHWPADRPWRPPFALTPDGRGLLVKRPRERVQLWDVDGGTLTTEWSWRLEGITCLAVAPDGLTAVAGGRFGRLLTWDLE